MSLKKKGPQTDDEKFAVKLVQEQELKRLHRQYTLLERDRSSFSEEAGTKLAKQRKVLKIFKKEHDNLRTDLSIATSDSKKQEDLRVSGTLLKQLDEYKEFTDRIKEKRTDIEEINDQIKQVDKQVQQLAAKQITDTQWEKRILAARTVNAKLENKLEVQVRKFCSLCAENRGKRNEIDHLLMERKDFRLIWDKLIANLNMGKKFMLDLIEQATIAYDQREEWCSKLQALRVKAHNDLILHTQDMREFKRRMDDDTKLGQFFRTKGQNRIMFDLEQKERIKRAEQRMETEETLEQYREMIKNISEFTGEESTEVIASKFLKKESENFVLFKYLNDLNKEMEQLNDTLGHYHMEIDQQKVLKETRTEQQKNNLEKLNNDLGTAKEKADDTENELEQANTTISNMMRGIDDHFKLCKCDADPLLQLLGDNNIIKDYNVQLYQEILERKVLALMLQLYHEEKILADKKKTKPGGNVIREEHRKPKIYQIDRIVSTNPCPLCVEHEQVSDVIDVLQHVLSRDQIKSKLEQRLELPDGLERLHNVSACHLPKSREIIQKRYQ